MSTSVRPLSPRLQELARTQINEDPKRTEQDLQHIKDWFKKQPHLNARTDDQWLLGFLRGCKFSLEKTKEKLDTYYTVRTLLPEFFSNRDPMLPEIQEVLKLGLPWSYPLPELDEKGRRILVGRVGAVDAGHIKLENILKAVFMLFDIILLEDDDLIISGFAILMDFKDVPLSQMIQMTPSITKKMATVYEEAYPSRPKEINYIRIPSMLMTIVNLVNSMVKEKLRKRIHFHGDELESLYKNIAQKNLPLEYGGEAGSMVDIAAAWKVKVESYREWFLDDEKHRTDEKKRPGKPKTHDSMFGIEGSFRQLSVD